MNDYDEGYDEGEEKGREKEKDRIQDIIYPEMITLKDVTKKAFRDIIKAIEKFENIIREI